MSILYEERERLSDSPYVETIEFARTARDASTVRPAEINWHMVVVRQRGRVQALVVGPLTTSGAVSFTEGAEILWIKFRLGAFMPHLPTKDFLDVETILPGATNNAFWLKGSAWPFPDYDNVETVIDRLVRQGVLIRDPLVNAALSDQPQAIPSRTLRHRFLRATGLTQSHIRQVERAKLAATLLRQGVSILDTVHEAGYSDQPHLTRSLKHFIGRTPAQLIRMSTPACHSIQDRVHFLGDNTNVLTNIR